MVGWHHRLNELEFKQTLGDVKDREAWCAAVHGVAEVENDLATHQWNMYVGFPGGSLG